jgi:hypothetical protein
LPLTEFTVDVVQEALEDLALEMGKRFSPVELSRMAAIVHRLSEGLPAMLARCLDWIEAGLWMGMDRLESQELFDRLASPYIDEGILTQDSLIPQYDESTEIRLTALRHAYRVLVPYRLFTQSHLRHHCRSDPAFSEALQDVPWLMEDLWKAMSATSLLKRPLREPWKEIHRPIRRLLHRYYYKTHAECAEAHSQARAFVAMWADKQVGKEQVIGLVECVWHEAVALRLQPPAEMERVLSESVASLSAALRPSQAYTPEELRSFAAEQMRSDEELEDAVSAVPGLFNRLAQIVLMPPLES